MNNRTAVILAIGGGLVGLAIGLSARFFFLDAYLASLSNKGASAPDSQQIAEHLHRDELVAASIKKLDARTKKAACEGYLGGLKEQGIAVSFVIKNACTES